MIKSLFAGTVLAISVVSALAQSAMIPGPGIGSSGGSVTCANVTNLEAWYKPSTIVATGANVTSWTDNTPKGRNLTCTNNPQKFTMLNGLSGVQFNGTNNKCQSTAFTLAQPFTIYAIFNPTVIGSGTRALQGTDANTSPNWVLRTTTMGWNSAANGDGLTISPTANTNYFIHAICNGLTVSMMALNSNADTTGSCSNSSMQAINLGGGNSSDFGNVAFGEVCIYSKAIASGSPDDTTIRTYFTAQWTKP